MSKYFFQEQASTYLISKMKGKLSENLINEIHEHLSILAVCADFKVTLKNAKRLALANGTKVHSIAKDSTSLAMEHLASISDNCPSTESINEVINEFYCSASEKFKTNIWRP